MTAVPVIRAAALRKVYPGQVRAALDGLDLAVGEGDCFGLLGPNGAGKTTLISILCGLAPPSAGSLALRALDGRWVGPADARAFVGMVPQDRAFYPALTVEENLRFFGAMHGLAGDRLRAGVEAALVAGALGTVRAQRAGTLSGGFARRLNLAIGVVHGPRVLVLDEPSVGMDPQSRLVLRDELRRRNAAGTTIVYTSHHLEEVEALCRTIAVIDRGRVIAAGPLETLTRSGAVRLELVAPAPPALRATLAALDTRGAPACSGNVVAFVAADPAGAMRSALEAAQACGVAVVAASCGRRDLESMFLELTGRTPTEDPVDVA